jgi:hypothetical protein
MDEQDRVNAAKAIRRTVLTRVQAPTQNLSKGISSILSSVVVSAFFIRY